MLTLASQKYHLTNYKIDNFNSKTIKKVKNFLILSWFLFLGQLEKVVKKLNFFNSS